MEIRSEKRINLETKKEQLLLGASNQDEEILESFSFGTINKIRKVREEEILFSNMKKEYWGLEVINLEDLTNLCYKTRMSVIKSKDYEKGVPKKVINALKDFVKVVEEKSGVKYKANMHEYYFIVNFNEKITGILAKITDESIAHDDAMFFVVADFTKNYMKPFREFFNILFHSQISVALYFLLLPMTTFVSFLLAMIFDGFGTVGYVVIYCVILSVGSIILAIDPNNKGSFVTCANGSNNLFRRFNSSLSNLKNSMYDSLSDTCRQGSDFCRRYLKKNMTKLVVKNIIATSFAFLLVLGVLNSEVFRANVILGFKNHKEFVTNKGNTIVVYHRDGYNPLSASIKVYN